jgi:hypothetical protein
LTYTFNDNFLMTGAIYYTNNWLNTGASGTYYSGIAKYTGTALPSGWNWYLSGELGYYDLGTTNYDYIAFPGPKRHAARRPRRLDPHPRQGQRRRYGAAQVR